MSSEKLEGYLDFNVIKISDKKREELLQPVATEVPCTLIVNGKEVATIMCTPTYLKEFAVGYFYSIGVINSSGDIVDFHCDTEKWQLDVKIATEIDIELLGKRIYTSGCGKGVMYSNIIALASRHPLESDFSVGKDFLARCAKWLLTCSPLYKSTHGVHTAALSLSRGLPQLHIDDIGRHNAVDKVIGYGLINAVDFSRSLLLCTGRISSEILQKAKRSNIPIVLSRGVPTHQTVLMARDMGVTVIGFARGGSFTIYAHESRIVL